MPFAIGNPGESAAARGVREWGLMVGLIVLLLVVPSIWALVYFSRTMGSTGLVLAAVGFFVAYLWRRRDVREIGNEFRDSCKWIKGAHGEFLVHQALATLSNEFIVFHDYHPRQADGHASKWNVDHIVVGPTGVFVLDAKNYSSTRVTAAGVNPHTKRNVEQVQRNALDLKNRLKTWSGGALAEVFVVPVVVYVQESAKVDSLREGSVRVLPLKLLTGEIQRHSEAAMDLERAGRVARALFGQLPFERQRVFKTDLDAYQVANRTERRVAPDRAAQTGAQQSDIPTVCPRCGGALVRKTARTGSRVGKEFLGCENFHTKGCRFGFNLD